MSERVFLIMISLPFITILLVFGMRYFAAVQQARVRQKADRDGRVEQERSLAALAETLHEVKARVIAIERMLKEVD